LEQVHSDAERRRHVANVPELEGEPEDLFTDIVGRVFRQRVAGIGATVRGLRVRGAGHTAFPAAFLNSLTKHTDKIVDTKEIYVPTGVKRHDYMVAKGIEHMP
jgi:hypothetical protein